MVDKLSSREYNLRRDNSVIEMVAELTPLIFSGEMVVSRISMISDSVLEFIVERTQINEGHFIWFNLNNFRWKTDVSNNDYRTAKYALKCAFKGYEL